MYKESKVNTGWEHLSIQTIGIDYIVISLCYYAVLGGSKLKTIDAASNSKHLSVRECERERESVFTLFLSLCSFCPPSERFSAQMPGE